MPGGTIAPDQTLQQGGGCQPVGAMQTRAGDFPDGIQIVDTRLSPFIHCHSAHKIVRCRYDRNRFAGDIKAGFKAFCVNIGKTCS